MDYDKVSVFYHRWKKKKTTSSSHPGFCLTSVLMFSLAAPKWAYISILFLFSVVLVYVCAFLNMKRKSHSLKWSFRGDSQFLCFLLSFFPRLSENLGPNPGPHTLPGGCSTTEIPLATHVTSNCDSFTDYSKSVYFSAQIHGYSLVIIWKFQNSSAHLSTLPH